MDGRSGKSIDSKSTTQLTSEDRKGRQSQSFLPDHLNHQDAFFSPTGENASFFSSTPIYRAQVRPNIQRKCADCEAEAKDNPEERIDQKPENCRPF